MAEYSLILLIGIIAGVLSGMFGIGGGAIIVPALLMITNLTITQATGTSLAALMLPVGILGVIVYYRSKLIDLRGALIIASGLLVFSMTGAMIANSINPQLLKRLYGIFLLYVSWRFIHPVELYRQWVCRRAGREFIGSEPADPYAGKGKWYWMLLLGLFAGLLSGMFGMGGGAIIVPVLITFMGYSTKRAIATSLGALLGPVGLPGVIVYYQQGQLVLPYAAIIASCLLAGAIFGAKITVKLPERRIKIMFGVFLLATGLKFIL